MPRNIYGNWLCILPRSYAIKKLNKSLFANLISTEWGWDFDINWQTFDAFYPRTSHAHACAWSGICLEIVSFARKLLQKLLQKFWRISWEQIWLENNAIPNAIQFGYILIFVFYLLLKDIQCFWIHTQCLTVNVVGLIVTLISTQISTKSRCAWSAMRLLLLFISAINVTVNRILRSYYTMIKYIDIITQFERGGIGECCNASTVVNHSVFLWNRFIFVVDVMESKLIIATLSRFVYSKQSYLFVRMSPNPRSRYYFIWQLDSFTLYSIPVILQIDCRSTE